MRIKRYSAKTEYEAMEQIRKDHGPEAYILHTKQVKSGGLFSFMKKPTVEILVGIEDENQKNKEIDQLLKETASTKKELDEIKKSLLVLSETLANKNREEAATPLPPKSLKSADAGDEDAEKASVQEGQNKRQGEKKKEKQPEEEPSLAESEGSEAKAEEEDLPKEGEPHLMKRERVLFDRLIARGMGGDIAEKLMEQVRVQVAGQEVTEERIDKLLKIAIKNALGFPYKINKDEKKRKIFFFVGPTGVGKTTTIAKIAARLSFIEGKDVALITADTFRIAAVDQLKTYGNILNIPINVVYKPIELEDALRKHEDCDFVLVDTAGRNHRDDKLKDYLDSYLSVAGDAEVFLLVSLTTSRADLDSIAEFYSFLEDYKLIFTKIDETMSPGNILNVKMKTGKSTSFVTNGQSVPDDIMLADPDEIARLIMGD